MFATKLISFAVISLISIISTEADSKNNVKRGIDDYGFPIGYGGVQWPLPASHLVEAAKKAAHEVYVAQQYVNSAREDAIFTQKLLNEKQAQATIAHQKNEAAHQKLSKALKDLDAAKAAANYALSEIHRAEQSTKLSHFKQSKAYPVPSPYPAPWSASPFFAGKPHHLGSY